MSKKAPLARLIAKDIEAALDHTNSQKIIYQNNSKVLIGYRQEGQIRVNQTIDCGTCVSAKKLALELSGTKSIKCAREIKYEKLLSHPWYGTVILEELTEQDRQFILLYIHENQNLDGQAYKNKTQLLFVDDPQKPANHAVIHEVLVCL